MRFLLSALLVLFSSQSWSYTSTLDPVDKSVSTEQMECDDLIEITTDETGATGSSGTAYDNNRKVMLSQLFSCSTVRLEWFASDPTEVCDGSTDNLAVFNAAEDYLDDAPGRKILIPNTGNECLLSDTWVVDAPQVQIECEGSGGPSSDQNPSADKDSCTLTNTASDTSEVVEIQASTAFGSSVNQVYMSIKNIGFKCEDDAVAAKDGLLINANANNAVFDISVSDCAGVGLVHGDDILSDNIKIKRLRTENVGKIIEAVDAAGGNYPANSGSNWEVDVLEIGARVNVNNTEEHLVDIPTLRGFNINSIILQGYLDASLDDQYISHIHAGPNEKGFIKSVHCEWVDGVGSPRNNEIEPHYSIYIADTLSAGSSHGSLKVEGLYCEKPISLSNVTMAIEIDEFSYDPDAVNYWEMIDESRVVDNDAFSYGKITFTNNFLSDYLPIEDTPSLKGRFELCHNDDDFHSCHPANQIVAKFNGDKFLDANSSSSNNLIENEYGYFNYASGVDDWGMFDDGNQRVFGIEADAGFPNIRWYSNITDDGQTDTVTCDTANDQIDATSHPFAENDLVHITAATTPCGGVLDTRRYYAVNVNTNDFQLSTCPVLTESGAEQDCGVVDITSTGSGTTTATKYHSYFGAQMFSHAKIKVVDVNSNITGTTAIRPQGNGNLMDNALGASFKITVETQDDTWYSAWLVGNIDEGSPNGTDMVGIQGTGTAPTSGEDLEVLIDHWYIGFGRYMSNMEDSSNSDDAPLVLQGCTAAPTAGDYIDGDMCINAGAAVGSPPYWMVTTPGSPGTWTAAPNL